MPDYTVPAKDSKVGEFRKLLRDALFYGDREAMARLDDYDYYRDGEFGDVMRNADWENIFDESEHRALKDASSRTGDRLADDPDRKISKFFARNLDESFRDFDSIGEWVREVQEGDFFDQLQGVYTESGNTPPDYLSQSNLKDNVYGTLAWRLAQESAGQPDGSGAKLAIGDRLQDIGQRANFTPEELAAVEAGGDPTNPDAGPADAFNLPAGGIANADTQALLQRVIHELGATDAANFFAALGVDINRPSEGAIHEREDLVREDQQQFEENLRTRLQDDQQSFEQGLATTERESAQGFQSSERQATENFQNQNREDIQQHELETIGLQGEVQDALERIRSGAETREGLQLERQGDGRVLNLSPTTDRDLDRASRENVAIYGAQGQVESARLTSGNNQRTGLTFDRNNDGTLRVNNPSTENDLQRHAAERIANIQAGLVDDREGTVAYADRESRERVAGVTGREGVTINDDGTITLQPGQISDRDLDRAVQTHIANIQAGLTQRQRGTEREADRDLQREVANIQSGQSQDFQGSVNQRDRESQEQIARINQGYVQAEGGTEAAADRDLARDVAQAGISSPYEYASQGGSISRLQAALAAQSTGGVAGNPFDAREFHEDQARIQASGGLSDPAQIARIQILDTINNPYAFVENYLQQQAQLQAAEQERVQRGSGNRAADQFGQVGASNDLSSFGADNQLQGARQTFQQPGTTLDPAVTQATELLRQTQLANAAPEIRQQNIDLLSNPQALGASVQLGGTDWVQNLLGITSQFTGAGASAKGDGSGARASEGGSQFLDPYVNNDNGLREAVELFNNDKIMTDGRQLFTRDTLGGFNQRPSSQQGFLTGAAAGAGITPDQLYQGLQSNTPNSRDQQKASSFRVV